MRFQRRLMLFFVTIVALPLMAAAILLQRMVSTATEEQTGRTIEAPLTSAGVLFETQAGVIDDQMQVAGVDPRLGRLLRDGDREGVNRLLQEFLDGAQEVDFVIALDRRKRVVGSAQRDGSFVRDFVTPDPSSVLATKTGAGPGFVRTSEIAVRSRGSGITGIVVGGFWVDSQLVREVATSDVDLSIVVDGRVIASTAPLTSSVAVDLDLEERFDMDLGEPATAGAIELSPDMELVASTPLGPRQALAGRVGKLMLLVVLIVLMVNAVLANLLARLITRPVEELSEAAGEIAEGRFDRRIPVKGIREFARLGAAFNDMTERLRETVSQLSLSRDQIRRAIEGVGEALRSTHDMKQILTSITQLATDAVAADAAVMWMLSPGGGELYPARSVGLESDKLHTIPLGRGVAGYVAEHAAPLLLPGPSGLEPGPGEPELRVTVAVPLYSRDRMRGVVAVYRHAADHPFSSDDLDTVLFLAQQGGVAVENVLLHEEAQRLAITDGLTGAWNRRYFSIQFRQVLASSKRFGRQFSVLMLDLDNFKNVNDTYGHQGGDNVLAEVAQRAQRVVREVDTFARYGGEEFVCLLTETDLEGAVTTAEKIIEAIRTEPHVVSGDKSISITGSIGVSTFPTHGSTLAALVEAADAAMYRAKQLGRDRVEVAASDKPSGLRLAT